MMKSALFSKLKQHIRRYEYIHGGKHMQARRFVNTHLKHNVPMPSIEIQNNQNNDTNKPDQKNQDTL